MEPTLEQKAAAILGHPLPPRDTPDFVRALAEIGRKDPQLAKALMVGTQAEPPQPDLKATERKIRAAQSAAERRARLRQGLQNAYERIFVRQASVSGRPLKAPKKGAWLLFLLLIVAAGIGVMYFSINTGQKPQQALLKMTPTQAQQLSDAELQQKAEEILGRPLPQPGDPDYERALEELRAKAPALANELDNRQKQAAATEAGKAVVQQLAAQTSSPSLSVTPPPSEPQGEAVPPPPQATPPPVVPPPPTAPSGSSAADPLPPAFPIQERPPGRPYLGEAGGGAASGQGSGGGSRGPVFVEAPAREGQAPSTTSDKDRTRAVGFEEAAANEPSLRVFDAGSPSSGPRGPIGPGMSPAASTGSGVAIWDNSSQPGQWKVLAEATPLVSNPPSSPTPSPTPSQPAPASASDSAQPRGPMLDLSFLAPSSPQAQTQDQKQAQTQATLAQAQAAPPRTYPYTPGRSVTARLQVRLAVVEGSESPVILEGADGSLWVGKATLGPLARVNIDLDTLYVGGSSYRVRAHAYDQDRQVGLVANVQEQAPSLAQDVLRASAAALGQYVDLLSKQTSTTQLPGGGVAQSQQAPPLEAVVLGNIGRLFALPSDRKSLVRVGQVEAGKVVQVMVMGFEGNP